LGATLLIILEAASSILALYQLGLFDARQAGGTGVRHAGGNRIAAEIAVIGSALPTRTLNGFACEFHDEAIFALVSDADA
jgi:hypothetical protein